MDKFPFYYYYYYNYYIDIIDFMDLFDFYEGVRVWFGCGFIRECTMYPFFSATIYNDKQMDQMVKFLTCPSKFTVFGVDPTFNIFHEDLSLTVTSYRNLKLINKRTKKPPVFIGPLFIHQKKDTSFYSKLAYNLISGNEDLSSVFAIGTDGESSLV